MFTSKAIMIQKPIHAANMIIELRPASLFAINSYRHLQCNMLLDINMCWMDESSCGE